MNIEEFREYCLSFKGVHEKMPFMLIFWMKTEISFIMLLLMLSFR